MKVLVDIPEVRASSKHCGSSTGGRCRGLTGGLAGGPFSCGIHDVRLESDLDACPLPCARLWERALRCRACLKGTQTRKAKP